MVLILMGQREVAMKSRAGNLDERLVVLEEKLEYQDYTLEKLNDVLIAQQRQLDEMEISLQRLREKIEIQELDGDQQGEEAPPPHF